MKYLVLLGDGMADFPLEALGGRTPLEIATTPAMDEVAARGLSGLFCPIPEGLPAGSDIGNLSVFGYDPRLSFTGRAPLEAANQNIIPTPDQLVFRCNLVTLADGSMVDFTAGHISTEEGRALIEALTLELGSSALRFVPGVGYRHLCIVQADEDTIEQLNHLDCTPPHDITNKECSSYMPKGDGAARVVATMEASRAVLQDHPVNQRRIAAGERPATSIWLWGQGGAPRITPYQEKFGITGAVVSAVDLVNGIGRCAGFEVLHVPGITGYLDTNYEGKVAAALDALTRHDFVYLHVEAPDEAAHEGKPDLKIQAIEDFDRRVVRPCLDAVTQRGDVRLLVAPDHVTSIDSRTHAGGPVPFALCGPGIAHNGLTAFSEIEAARAGVLYANGHELTAAMIREQEIGLEAVS